MSRPGVKKKKKKKDNNSDGITTGFRVLQYRLLSPYASEASPVKEHKKNSILLPFFEIPKFVGSHRIASVNTFFSKVKS